MANDVPPTFNGKPTEYSFGDGFRNLSTVGKVLDVAAFVFSAGTLFLIPVAIELMAWNNAKNTEKEARAAMQSGHTRPVYAMGDNSPETTRFREAYAQQQNANRANHR